MTPKFKRGDLVEYESALEEGTWDEVKIEEVEVRGNEIIYHYNGYMCSGQAPEECFRELKE